jgi:nucleoside-diphosphate-sugar epimerase
MRIVILGANGQIGRNLTLRLNYDFKLSEVIPCARRNTQHDTMLFNPFAHDWKMLGKVDWLINCIGIIEERNGDTYEKVNYEISRLIAENYFVIGSPKVIHLSALGANHRSPVRFLRSKGKADRLLLKLPRTTVLRPSIVCNKDTMLVRKLRLLKTISKFYFGRIPFPEHLLKTSVQPVMINDLTEAISALIKSGNENYPLVNISGNRQFTLEELIEFTGKNVKIIRFPKTPSNLFLRSVAAIFPYIISSEQYRLLHVNNTADNAMFSEILGREPEDTGNFWIEQLYK